MRLRKYLAVICLLAVALLPGKAEAAKNYHGGQLYFGMGGSVCALNTKTGKVKKICEVLKTDTDPIGTIVYYKGNLYFSVDLAEAEGEYGRHQRYIYRVGANGKGKKRLAPGYAPQIADGKIYYIAESYNKKTKYGKSAGLYEMKTDGTKKEAVVLDDVREFAVVKNWLFWISSEGKNPKKKGTYLNYHPLIYIDLNDPDKKQEYDSPFYETGYLVDYDDNYVYYTDEYDQDEIRSRGTSDIDERNWGNYRRHVLPEVIDIFSKKCKHLPSRFIGFQNDCYVYRLEEQWKYYNPLTGKATVLKGLTGRGERDELIAAGGGWLVLAHPAKNGDKTSLSVIRTNGKNLKTLYTWKDPRQG